MYTATLSKFGPLLQYWLETSVPRVPLKVQRALQRERVEREHKGVFGDSEGGDYAKFEANFSRALTSNTASTTMIGGRTFASKTNVGNSATKAVAVNEDLTATTPTPSGRARKGFTVNLSASPAAGSTAISPARSLATVPDHSTPRSSPMSVPRDRKVNSVKSSVVHLPPPSAATRFEGSEAAVTPLTPPLPPRRFDWDADAQRTL